MILWILQFYFSHKDGDICMINLQHTRCLKSNLRDPVNTSHVLFLDRCYYDMVVWHKFTLYLIFSSNVCEYLRQCLRNYPETLLGDREVSVCGIFYVAFFVTRLRIIRRAYSFCLVGTIQPCSESGSSTNSIRFPIRWNKDWRSIFNTPGHTQMALTWTWF